MTPIRIFTISCFVASALFSVIANSQSTDIPSIFITKAMEYVKANDPELSSIHDVKYEIVSENVKEVVVSVIGHDIEIERFFVPELNKFEEHTTVASRGIYLFFCKNDQEIYKVRYTQ